MWQRVKIKICGMTNVADAKLAGQLGVDAIGLIFFALSERQVTIENAKKICDILPPFVNRTAVFVNEAPEKIREILTQVPIDLLQFHGDEPPNFCQQFNKPYIKTLSMKLDMDVRKFCEIYASAQAILLDTYHQHLKGGTGERFDWRLIPHDLIKPIILAGGINMGNISDAVTQVRPYAVDVLSGVEIKKGVKDASKMRDLLQALALANRHLII